MAFGNPLRPLSPVAPRSRALPQGISIHIGLNHVDPDAYNGWDGELAGCINDANDMRDIANGLGYQSSTLIDSQATSHAVIGAIGRAAQTLRSGDILVLTYSGHGGQVDDVNGDEDDAQDETWVLWDRQLIDDELFSLWAQFAAGVRIFVLSDSCHSGTVLRQQVARQMLQVTSKSRAKSKFRVVTREDRQKYFDTSPKVRAASETAQFCAGPSERAIVQATVILISGCQDDQLSADGTGNGLFTEKLKTVWNNGTFTGGYRQFWSEIRGSMPMNQLPNYFVIGASNASFEMEKPFTIGSGSGSSSSSSTPTTRPTLRRGSSGPDVTFLQQRLVAHGYSVSVDGIFGGGTEDTVMSFQGDMGLGIDGIVGRETWRALEKTPADSSSTPSTPSGPPTNGSSGSDSLSHPDLRMGSKGPAVRHLQQLLIADGATLMADGDFGPKTASAVRAFQSTHGLTPDGIVGTETWNGLEPAGSCRRSAEELVTV